MSTEDNKALVRRVIEEGLNQGNVALVDELFAPNFLYNNPPWPNVRTREDYKQWQTWTRNGFPDFQITIDEMIAEGDKVVVRYTLRGTNTGDLVMPMTRIPATGKQVTVTGIGIFRFAGEKGVEMWLQGDDLGMFQQLGLIPVPEPVS